MDQAVPAAHTTPSCLRVGYETGMMPAKWFTRWRERLPGSHLEDAELPPGTWRDHLGGNYHVALVRLPAHPKPGSQDLEGLRGHYRAILAYQEQQVVVLPTDHELTLLDHVSITDLADERLVHDLSDLPEYTPSPHGAGTDEHGMPLPALESRSTEDVIEYVAAGLGLAVVPMSLARFHYRRDLTYRAVTDLPGIDVAVVWPQNLDDATEALVQELVGVVRGRRPGSSRGRAVPHKTEESASLRKPGRKSKPANATETPTRTAKGTSRGDQLKGKRLAGGKPRRNKPSGNPGRPGKRNTASRKRH